MDQGHDALGGCKPSCPQRHRLKQCQTGRTADQPLSGASQLLRPASPALDPQLMPGGKHLGSHREIWRVALDDHTSCIDPRNMGKVTSDSRMPGGSEGILIVE